MHACVHARVRGLRIRKMKRLMWNRFFLTFKLCDLPKLWCGNAVPLKKVVIDFLFLFLSSIKYSKKLDEPVHSGRAKKVVRHSPRIFYAALEVKTMAIDQSSFLLINPIPFAWILFA